MPILIFLFFLILINMNIILLNEETLILICFSTFCFLSAHKLGMYTYDYFENLKTNLKIVLDKKIKQNLNLLDSNIQLNKKELIWIYEFKKFKNHFNFFNKNLLLKIFITHENKVKSKITKKLLFAKHLEYQSSKLISLILIEKLNKIITTNKFCFYNLNFFPAINKINFREYLQKIN